MSNDFFLLQYSPILDEKNNDGLVVDQSNTILKVTYRLCTGCPRKMSPLKLIYNLAKSALITEGF